MNTRKQLALTLNQFYHQPIARVSLELFLSLGTIIFFGIFAIQPTLLTMSDLIKEIEDKRALNAQLAQKVAALSTAQNEMQVISTQLPLLDQAIPTSPQVITAVKVIEKIASDRGLVITNLNVPEIPADTTITPTTTLKRQSLSISMSVTGDYPTIRQFIEDLRGSRRTFEIQNVVFSTDSEQNRTILRASITIGLPYLSV